jgi:hypothetical protein
MNKNLFAFVFAILSGIVFSQSIPNGGFESWTTTSYEDPVGFQTSNFNENNGVISGINATKTTDAYHGNYAIKLLTVATGTDVSFAYFANGDPGKNPVNGGIPYNQKPNGVRFHYKCNILGTDTAIFLACFKKAGVSLGNYFFKITGTQTNYTLFNATFSPALTTAPDSIVIAACSSNAFANFGVIGSSLQVDSVIFTGVASQPANLNGDFENWQTKVDDKLNGWNVRGGYQRTTDVFSGNFAVELQTTVQTFGGSGISAGEANTGVNNGGGWKGGFPYTTQVDTLVFYYKYIPADPNDQGEIYTAFKKNGVQFYQTFNALTISPSYKKVSISYSLSMMPDTINVSFRSSKYPYLNSYSGSDLKVDNMYLTSQKIPITSYTLPPFGCVGQTIQLTDNSGNMANAWAWIMPGANPGSSTSQNPAITYNAPGTKTISMIATNQFGSGSLISKTITINPLPNVVSTSTVTGCFSNSATLTASGATSYSWSNGSTGATIAVSPSVTTSYTVGGIAAGCIDFGVGYVVVPSVPKPDICMVTVDSTNTYNQIYWDKTQYPMLDSMIIYRQVATNTYKRIGRVSKNALSMFNDTIRSVGPANGDPNISTYRYKIQVRDTCGKYGPMSLWHNTVYFTHTGGVFFWINNYSVEGPVFPSNPVVTYSLMVCANPTISPVFTPVGITAGNQFTLNDPNYNSYSTTADWRVEADLGYICNATLKTTAAKITKSRSNIQNNRIIGIKENILSTGVHVYPNPTTNVINIGFEAIVDDVQISLVNVIGQTVYSEKINKATAIRTIDVSGFAKGIYTLSLSSQNGKGQYKVVIE